MTKAEIFIEKYKELEDVIIQKYHLSKNDSPVYYLERLKEFDKYHKELTYCREVRNFLQHETKIKKDFAIIPSDEMISAISNLIELLSKPPLCESIAIKKNSIYFRSMNDYVMPSMKELSHKKYTHIPLLCDGKVVGVFSKSSIFNYLLDNDWKKIDNKLRFKDIEMYVGINSHTSEGYLFIKQNSTISEAVMEIETNFRNGKRISLVFLTKNGTQNEVIFGMFTPWDVLGY